ncbi:putative RNA-binding protein 23 isoform X2 [Rhinoderma darwinii]|uniref:putative RNA-binding protein 23 isoform X2 n=1 Tax=Rhinoderma darwinii TaxID=43563 RepID=UPI003F67E4AB
MASNDFDIVIEATLEAPCKGQEKEEEIQNKEIKEQESSSHSGNNGSQSSSSKKRSPTRSRDQRRSLSRDHRRRRSSRDGHRSRERRHRSRSRGRRYSSRSRDRSCRHEERFRRRSPGRHYARNRSRSPRHKEKSPYRPPKSYLTAEERDVRTVLCMQLAARIRPRDLVDFFSPVGKVRDVKIISDKNSRRTRGIAYVEFVEIQTAQLAIGLTGQRLLGVPIIVQPSQAEKNRLAAIASLQRENTRDMCVYVGSLHFNITEDMLRGIFEPFGKFADAECARWALDQLNGFELAGRPMKVGHLTDKVDGRTDVPNKDDLEQRLKLQSSSCPQIVTSKLADDPGMQMPFAAPPALQLNEAIPGTALDPVLSAFNPALNLETESISPQCFELLHLFNLQTM